MGIIDSRLNKIIQAVKESTGVPIIVATILGLIGIVALFIKG